MEPKVENALPLAADWTGVAARPADEENRSRSWTMAEARRPRWLPDFLLHAPALESRS